jgi:hypothetical protein
MPCDTVQTARVELGNVDKVLLGAAMAQLNLRNYSYQNGVLVIKGQRASAELTSQVKRAYSSQVVQSQAKKFGWQMKQTGDMQWQVTRR